MNDSGFWDEGSIFYEQLMGVHDMINLGWYAQDSRCYE